MTDLATLSVKVEADTVELRKLTSEMKRADLSADKLQKTIDKSAKRLQEAMKIYEKYSTAIDRTERTHGRLSSEFIKNTANATKLSGAISSATRSLASFEAENIKTQRELNKTDAKVKQTTSSMSKMHGTLTSLRGVFAALGLGVVANELIRVGNAFDRTRITLSTIVGDGNAAKTAFGFLQKTARDLGVNFLALTDSYGQLAAATKNTSLEGEGLNKIFTAIAKTAAVMRFDVENTRGIMKAFEQMISKGTVQAEELRNQLGDRMPQAFTLFVRAFKGLTATQVVGREEMLKYRKEFNATMKAGEVVTETILPKVAQLLEEIYGPGIAQASKSAFAEINRLSNAFQNLADAGWLAGIAQGVGNVAKSLRELFENQKFVDFVKGLSSAFGTLTQVLYDNGNALAGVVIGLSVFASSAIVLNIISIAKSLFTVGAFATKTAAVLGILSAAAGFLFTVFAKNDKQVGETATAMSNYEETTKTASKATEFMTASLGSMNDAAADPIMEKLISMRREYTTETAHAVKETDNLGESFNYMKALEIGGIFVAATQAVRYLLPQLNRAKDTAVSMATAVKNSVTGFGAGASKSVNRMISYSMADAGLTNYGGRAFAQAALESGRAAKGMAALNVQGRILARVMDVAVFSVASFGRALGGVFTLLGGWPGLIIAAGTALAYFVIQQKAATNSALEYINSLAMEGAGHKKLADTVAGSAAQKADALDNENAKIEENIKANQKLYESQSNLYKLELARKQASLDDRSFSLNMGVAGATDRIDAGASHIPGIPDSAIDSYVKLKAEVAQLQENLRRAEIAIQNQAAAARNAIKDNTEAAVALREYGDMSDEAAQQIEEFIKVQQKKNHRRELTDMEELIEKFTDLRDNTKGLTEEGRKNLQLAIDLAQAEQNRRDSVERLKEATSDLKSVTNELTNDYKKYRDVLELVGKTELQKAEIKRKQDIAEEAEKLAERIKLMKEVGTTQTEINQAITEYLVMVKAINATRDEDVKKIREEGNELGKYMTELADNVRFVGENEKAQKKLDVEKKKAEAIEKALTAAKKDAEKVGRSVVGLTEAEVQAINDYIDAEEEAIKVRDKATEKMKDYEDIWDRFKDSIKGDSTDFWSNLILEGKSAWGNLFDDIKTSFSRLVGELLDEWISSGLIQSIKGVMDGTGSVSGVVAAGGQAAATAGLLTGGKTGNIIGSIGAIISGGALIGDKAITAISHGVTKAFGSRAFGTAIANGLQFAGYGAIGGLGANLLGLGNNIEGTIGGTIGSIAGGAGGAALLGQILGSWAGPVGAVLGGFLGTALGGLLAGRPSDKTQGGVYNPRTGQYERRGATGSKYSKENDDAVQAFVDRISEFQKGVQNTIGGKSNSGDFLVEYGDRDGVRVTLMGVKQKFESFDDAFKYVATNILKTMTTANADVQTALEHLGGSDVPLEKQLDLIGFAAHFQDMLDAMNSGVMKVEDDTRLAAREEIKKLVDQIREFKDLTAQAGLSTDKASTATRAYVERLLGLRDTTDNKSELAQALERLKGIFEEIGPLLDEVGIGADKAASLFQQAKQKLADQFNAGIEGRILNVDKPAVGKIYSIIQQKDQDLLDAGDLGGNVSRVLTLFGKELHNAVSGLSIDDLNDLYNYFIGLNNITDDVVAVLHEVTHTILAMRDDFNADIQRQLTIARNPGSEGLLSLDDWFRSALDQAAKLGITNITPITELYVLKQVALANQDRVEALKEEEGVIQDTIKLFDKLPDKLKDFRLSLLTNKDLSPLSPLDRLTEARKQLEDIVKDSTNTDPAVAAAALDKLPDLSQRLLEASRDYYASSEGYFQDFQRVQNILSNGEARAVSEIAVQQSQLDELKAIHAALDKPGGSNYVAPSATPVTVAQAQAITQSFGASQARFLQGGGTVEQFTQTAEFAAWERVRDGIVAGLSDIPYLMESLTQAQNQQIGDSPYKAAGGRYEAAVRARLHELKVPGFASGGMAEAGLKVVGERGPELMMTGAARFFNASQTMELLGRADASSTVSIIREQVNVTIAGFKGVWDRLDNVTEELQGIRRELKK